MSSEEIDPIKYLESLFTTDELLQLPVRDFGEPRPERQYFHGDFIRIKLPGYTLLVPFSTYRPNHYLAIQQVMTLLQESKQVARVENTVPKFALADNPPLVDLDKHTLAVDQHDNYER